MLKNITGIIGEITVVKYVILDASKSELSNLNTMPDDHNSSHKITAEANLWKIQSFFLFSGDLPCM